MAVESGGVIPATMIQEMLKQSKVSGGTGNITDLCDYVVGTSVGGILGAGLVVTKDGKTPLYSVDDIVNIFTEEANTIFSKPQCDNSWIVNTGSSLLSHRDGLQSSWYPWIIGGTVAVSVALPLLGMYLGGISLALAIVVGEAAFAGGFGYHVTQILSNTNTTCVLQEYAAPMYDRRGLDSILESKFVNLTLTDTIIPFTTFSFSLSDGVVKSFSSFKAMQTESDNFYIRDAAGATSAAPTFFKHKVIRAANGDIHHEVDSGIYLNSPISAAITILMKHAPDSVRERIKLEGISVLSLGTGYHISTNIQNELGGEGKIAWAPLAIRLAMEGSEYAGIIDGKYLHNASRIDVELETNIPMDTTDMEVIQALVSMAQARVHEQDVQDYVQCVVQQTDTACHVAGSLPFEKSYYIGD